MPGYETRYAIVAGVGWIRWTRVDDVEDIWLITFGDEPRAAKGPAGDNTILRGQLGGISWDLSAEDLAPPLQTPHPLLRPVASTQMETQPAQLFTGRIGDPRSSVRRGIPRICGAAAMRGPGAGHTRRAPTGAGRIFSRQRFVDCRRCRNMRLTSTAQACRSRAEPSRRRRFASDRMQ